jgi:protocatechuate 3,4-dioxygenase beta subunit
MYRIYESRRDFLKRASLGTLAIPFLISCGESTLAQKSDGDVLAQIKKMAAPNGTEGMGAIDVPADISWRAMLANENTEGESMVISGTVFRPDGKTPAPNTLIYLYHTDMYGIYGRGSEPKHGKFRGWMLSDPQGRYEFRSIRPASYPNTTISAHVHMTVTTADAREDWIDSILFEGDRFISHRERESAGKRGGFQPIVTLVKGADGVLKASRNIQLLS